MMKSKNTNTTRPARQRQMLMKALYINGDDDLLLRKMDRGDRVAMLQLAMLHMPRIISELELMQNKQAPMTAIVDVAMEVFIAATETTAREGTRMQPGRIWLL